MNEDDDKSQRMRISNRRRKQEEIAGNVWLSKVGLSNEKEAKQTTDVPKEKDTAQKGKAMVVMPYVLFRGL